jgi:hypothetical protein
MHIKASVRPPGLKRGTTTKAFYKGIGYKDPHGPDIRDVVGTLTLGVTRRDELSFLASLREFLVSDQPGSLVITLGGKELASMTRDAEDESQQQDDPEGEPATEAPVVEKSST